MGCARVSSSRTDRLPYRADIDGLRTLAVLPVIAFHAGLGLDGGYVGVDVFFVISGYLITSLIVLDLKNGRFSLLGFYERRARRILPALFVMMGVTAGVAAVFLMPSDLSDFGMSAIYAALFAGNIWFYKDTGYFNEAAELKPLLHTWSLGIEEQFYLGFPFLMLALFWLTRMRGCFLVIAAGFAFSLALSIWALEDAPLKAFYWPTHRAWELATGALLSIAASNGWLERFKGRHALALALGILGLALIGSSVLLYGPETPFPGLAALPVCLGTAMVIASGTLAETPVSKLLGTAPMVFVGKLSYSLYLWHWPVLVFAFYVSSGPLTAEQGAVCLVVAFGLAYVSWRYVEQPFRDRSRFTRTQIFAGAAASIAALAAAGAGFAALNGLPGRMPIEIQTLLKRENLVAGRRECHFVTPRRALDGDVCIRGDMTREPTFILAGDSHAEALSPAIFEAAEALGLSGYQFTNPGFRPMPGVWYQGFRGYVDLTEAFVAFVAARPEISTIFVSGYWEHQFTGYTYRYSGLVFLDDGYDGSGTAYNKTATLDGFRRLAERLPGVRIVLLDDVPSGHALHLPTQARLLRFGHEASAGLPRKEADRQRATYEPHFLRLAGEQPTIDYRRLFADFCSEGRCPLFKDGQAVYRNGDHLSVHGARLFVPRIQELMRSYLLDGGEQTKP